MCAEKKRVFVLKHQKVVYMFLAANPWSFSLNSVELIIDLESVD